MGVRLVIHKSNIDFAFYTTGTLRFHLVVVADPSGDVFNLRIMQSAE